MTRAKKRKKSSNNLEVSKTNQPVVEDKKRPPLQCPLSLDRCSENENSDFDEPLDVEAGTVGRCELRHEYVEKDGNRRAEDFHESVNGEECNGTLNNEHLLPKASIVVDDRKDSVENTCMEVATFLTDEEDGPVIGAEVPVHLGNMCKSGFVDSDDRITSDTSIGDKPHEHSDTVRPCRSSGGIGTPIIDDKGSDTPPVQNTGSATSIHLPLKRHTLCSDNNNKRIGVDSGKERSQSYSDSPCLCVMDSSTQGLPCRRVGCLFDVGHASTPVSFASLTSLRTVRDGRGSLGNFIKIGSPGHDEGTLV